MCLWWTLGSERVYSELNDCHFVPSCKSIQRSECYIIILPHSLCCLYYVCSKYAHTHTHSPLQQFLLGIFYYVEAVVLFEDIQSNLLLFNLTAPDLPAGTYFDGVDYYNTDLVSSGYQTAA